jgi:hypothetical protein
MCVMDACNSWQGLLAGYDKVTETSHSMKDG